MIPNKVIPLARSRRGLQRLMTTHRPKMNLLIASIRATSPGGHRDDTGAGIGKHANLRLHRGTYDNL